MRDIGILFQGPMVRAVRADTKTQTRREVKWCGIEPGLNLQFSGLSVERSGSNFVLTSPTRTSHAYRSVPQPCPYGEPGDRLWVRESWMPDPPDDGTWGYTAWAGERIGRIAAVPERFRHPAFCNYAAGWLHGQVLWTPGIHMPRWASRITLEITGVRVERLQDISEDDALAEGITCENVIVDAHCAGGRHTEVTADRFFYEGGDEDGYESGIDAYAALWESINGAGSWGANPYVWVVEFKRVQPC